MTDFSPPYFFIRTGARRKGKSTIASCVAYPLVQISASLGDSCPQTDVACNDIRLAMNVVAIVVTRQRMRMIDLCPLFHGSQSQPLMTEDQISAGVRSSFFFHTLGKGLAHTELKHFNFTSILPKAWPPEYPFMLQHQSQLRPHPRMACIDHCMTRYVAYPC